ncbi:tetratricopeptide repeat-containing hybrid sensor histidine kinase/response regulator [Gillisia limnaea]|uniref:histidine kinase n=1 Tax=Gillisia limnaea (strain DSM 15749 / LMG 21470 / R-8282) TaxID=865937 RepID=H2BRK6_GILLR|nr:response regulator [Gillisia limnaea]EHQ04525.1 ATP-binding region ATPase domain protein [Gillisia limnaea DSM 15749]
MKKNYYLIFLIGIICANSFAQDNVYLDSIYKLSSRYLSKYEYKESIETALRLLEETKTINNEYYHYQAHSNLGAAFSDINDTLYSRQHYKDALKIALELDNDTLLLSSYNNLGNVYSEDINTTQIGIDYYNKTIELATKMNYESKLLAPTANIAWTYIDNGKYDKALPYLKDSWKLLGDRDNNLIKAQLLTLMGRYHMGINELENARGHFEQAIQKTEKDTLILEASLAYKEYAAVLFEEGNFEAAFIALEEYNGFKDQIFQEEKLKQIRDANIKFEVSQYQEDLEIAKDEQLYKDEVIAKSREKMLVLVISAIVMFIVLIILFRIILSRRKLILELSEKNKELQLAKEEAERLSILKTQFFSTISHELRTPLYGVIGLTSILMEDKSLIKHESDLKSLKFSADYLLALINDVLQMNKMDSNLLKLEKLPFNLKDLMKSIVKSFEFTRLQNKNSIHLDIDSNITYNLIGDPVRLSQILMNLVGNAMKFTERGGIWITSRLVEEGIDSVKVYFEIKDDGLGIPKSKQEIIFEEFSQLKYENYNYQGTGLGLPIVKKLLNLFESEIYLDSSEGEGSVFSFEIEFKKGGLSKSEPEIAGSIETSSTLSETEGVGKHILIVDDNRINQVVTQRILEQKSFSCDISDNGLDSIEKIKNKNYDLVLMDLNMPGISGLEATRQIRKFNKILPVIALTAVEIEEVRQEIHDAGMNDIIIKPYDNATFFQVIYRNISKEVVAQ